MCVYYHLCKHGLFVLLESQYLGIHNTQKAMVDRISQIYGKIKELFKIVVVDLVFVLYNIFLFRKILARCNI